MSIRVESPALITTVQDSGRQGFLRFGVPPSGPMDWWAFLAANQLVGNSSVDACLEIGMTSCVLQMQSEAMAAVCGAGYRLYRGQDRMPLWMSFLLQPGDRLVFEKCPGGNWVYLALTGGIQSEVWLGSRSVYPRGKLGRTLQIDDQLDTKSLSKRSRLLAGQRFPDPLQPAYSQRPLLRVIMGPDEAHFEEASIKQFFNQTYQVSTQSDRMGYRLSGPSLRHIVGADVVSRGLAMGEIQVPGNGQPIVMMADHPTTGGYTVLGAVCKMDWPLLAQAQPDQAEIRFAPITVSEAQGSLITIIENFNSDPTEQEDLWLNL